MNASMLVADINEPALLLRIDELYRDGMTGIELYDVTRGVWRVGTRRRDAKLAIAVVHSRIVAVYAIHAWNKAGSTHYESGRTIDLNRYEGRWEFTGKPASPEIIQKYVGLSATNYYSPHAQNPIRYVNC